jgi:hypothetical protein
MYIDFIVTNNKPTTPRCERGAEMARVNIRASRIQQRVPSYSSHFLKTRPLFHTAS